MSSFDKSFASLVKTNNGLFKSEKQAKFLIDQCDSIDSKKERAVYHVLGNVHGNSFTLTYICDFKGVLKVEKHTPKTNKTVITWERPQDGKTTAQDAKEIKRIKREINKAKKSIKEREDNKQDYINRDMLDLFERSMNQDLDYLKSMKERLNKYIK